MRALLLLALAGCSLARAEGDADKIAAGKTGGAIIVGIWNNGLSRFPEYMPQKAIEQVAEADLDGFLGLARACLQRGVLLLDHVLVAGSTWVSTDSIFLSVLVCDSAIFLTMSVVVAQPTSDRPTAAARRVTGTFMSPPCSLVQPPLMGGSVPR